MISKEKLNGNSLTGVANEGIWPGIDSRFRLIIVAGLRAKQLLRGSTPRIEADKGRRRNTSIALEEVKRGLVHFSKFTTVGTTRHYEAKDFDRTDKDAGNRKESRARIASL